MFPFFDDALLSPNMPRGGFGEPFINTFMSIANQSDPFVAVSQLHRSMNDFVDRSTRAIFSDLDNMACSFNQQFRPDGNDEFVNYSRNRLQWYDSNTRRQQSPPAKTSSRHAINYLDQLPSSTVRVRNLPPSDSEQPGANNPASGSSVDPDLTGATGNNAIMEKKGDASQKDSTGGFLEYSLVIDSKSERRLHHLIPVQPLQVTPSARKPECDICLLEYESGQKLRHLPCGHGFHRSCIDTWLKTSDTCPKCRKNIVVTLRKMQERNNKGRSQSLSRVRPSNYSLIQKQSRANSSSAGATSTESYSSKMRADKEIIHTRSSILRNQLAEQRRACDTSVAGASKAHINSLTPISRSSRKPPLATTTGTSAHCSRRHQQHNHPEPSQLSPPPPQPRPRSRNSKLLTFRAHSTPPPPAAQHICPPGESESVGPRTSWHSNRPGAPKGRPPRAPPKRNVGLVAGDVDDGTPDVRLQRNAGHHQPTALEARQKAVEAALRRFETTQPQTAETASEEQHVDGVNT